MKITAQTEVSPSTFIMQNENGQASMDFLFVLFLQLIQSALDILNPSEEPNSDLGAINSQDAKPNYQRALNFMEDNPSLRETFNQAISFVFWLSQFITDKEVNLQDVSLSIKFNNTTNKELIKLNLINIGSKDQKFSFDPKDLFLQNQALSLTDDKGIETIKPILLSNNTLQSLSSFISKAWKEYKALLKDKGEEININMQSIKNEFFVKLNTDWEGLPEEAKAYLKEVLANSIFNQNKMGHNVYPNLKNSLNNNGINGMKDLSAEKKTGVNEILEVNTNNNNEMQGLSAEKKIGVAEVLELNTTKKDVILGNRQHDILKGNKKLGDNILQEVKTILTNVLEREEDHKEIRSFLKELVEKSEPFGSKSSERDNLFVPPTQTEEAPSTLAMHSADKTQAQSLLAHKITLRELPDFVRNLVFEVHPQGEQKARLELFPPELGRLDIEVRVENGEVSVVGKLENPQAYQDILKEAPVIKTHLEELGLKVKELVFTLTSGDANLPYHGDRQPKENKDGLSVKNNSKLLTQRIPKEETLVNAKGRYYYIV
ncbi:MAG: flagellar hook-length control protein FliK [Thermodesulfobacterium sp.]|jgi:flagellar hook-length control protein FliK|nr:flagellar hook-length control protein FliK [Thermodesulfobacterium sp.]